jgi:glyoxylase-like metal-dependent hydrolase (beta-lactamase superfamily II)
MRELSTGLWHWTARHPHIHSDVSSYYLASERVLLDPLLPPEGFEFFERLSTPEHVLLTNRHHDRDAWKLRERFGCEVHCVANGCYELEGRGPVTPFEFGDELPGGVRVHEVDAICPDETALHIPAHRALACADGVVRGTGVDGLTFVPDELMDDPADTKRALASAYQRLLELDFELLLLAHGEPVTAGARRQLERFTTAALS